jgi:hypothetical protein
MKIALLTAMILFPSLLQANTVKIVSPDTEQTYTYSDMTWHSLRWDAARQELSARITFSNYNYVTHTEPLDEESYSFAFPGVKFDRASNTFFARTSNGKLVPVAVLSKDLIGQSIKPLPGTVIHVFKQSGKVTVTLTGSSSPLESGVRFHWVEDNGAFSFGNLNLCRN